jgi:hypothetical protein
VKGAVVTSNQSQNAPTLTVTSVGAHCVGGKRATACIISVNPRHGAWIFLFSVIYVTTTTPFFNPLCLLLRALCFMYHDCAATHAFFLSDDVLKQKYISFVSRLFYNHSHSMEQLTSYKTIVIP